MNEFAENTVSDMEQPRAMKFRFALFSIDKQGKMTFKADYHTFSGAEQAFIRACPDKGELMMILPCCSGNEHDWQEYGE